ncbi:MAG: transporter substrate-binding domain-containing protein [Thiotrichales bacterium]
MRYEAAQVGERILPLDFPLGVVYRDRIDTVARVIVEKGGDAYDLSRLNDFLFIEPSSIVRQIELTQEERAWLKAHPRIRVGIDPKWAPVEFFDESGVGQGISIAYLRRLERMLGVRFEIVSDLSWQEAHDRLERGELDLLPAISKTPQRSRLFHFTEPYLSLPIKIFSAADVAYLGKIDALRGERVAVVAGYAIHTWLERDYPELVLEPAPSLDEAVRWVATGKAYALIDNLVTASYYIGKSGLTQVRVAGETPYSNRLGMATRQDAPLLASILQKGLDAIPQSERDAIYNEWISIRYEHGVDYALLWKLLSAAGLILTAMFYWNRRLTREIDQRHAVEEALTQATQAAEASNRAKGEFLAQMSHEIRTPMNAMIGLTARLKHTELTPKQADYLEKIQRASATLLGIINDILDVAKIEAKKQLRFGWRTCCSRSNPCTRIRLSNRDSGS